MASIYPGGNVLVTGGSKGIGLAAVQKLLKGTKKKKRC